MTRHLLLPLFVLPALSCTVTSADPPDDDGTTPPEETPCVSNDECAGIAATPICDLDQGQCVALGPGHQLGWGDGSPTSVTLATVYTPERPLEVTDLAFHPERTNELWILRRELHSDQPCEQNNATNAGCSALEGSVAVLWNPGTAEAGMQVYVDPNAWHFMRRPPAFAFGADGTFASVGEERSGNYLDDPLDYIGPTLWSSALPGVSAGCEDSPKGCFSVQPPGGNGSHLDMLHASPWAMGIAHEEANIYWVFNGDIGALDRYDFKLDHGPGNEDHSDGELLRYVEGQLTRLPDVPSHMAFDPETKRLYVADSGAGRVVALDTTRGTPSGPALPNHDFLEVCESMGDASLEEVVPAGTLMAPSGLALHDGVLYVADHGTGKMHAFSLDGTEVNSLDTGMGPGVLAGFAIGPDGKAYFVDMPNGAVYRIDPL
jgi:hypothetical protein